MSNMVQKKVQLFDVVNMFLLILLSAIFLYPLIVMLSTSISDPAIMYSSNVYLLPYGFSLEAYKTLFERSNIIRCYWNTITYAVGTTVVMLFATSTMAYALLDMHALKGRRLVNVLLVITMFFGGGLVPAYLNVKMLGMLNTYWAMVFPGALSAYNVIVFRTFFRGIPKDIYESARIDGAGHLRILFQMYVPLSKALMATFTLFTIVGCWNDYLTALIYLSNEDMYPIQLFLRKILNASMMEDISDYALQEQLKKVNTRTVKAASVMITIAPILCIYPFLQKYFTKGLLVGSIKG